MPLNSLKNRTWILVADGARALLIRNEGSATRPKFALIRRYEQEQVILGYRTVLNEEKLGLDHVRAVIEVKISPDNAVVRVSARDRPGVVINVNAWPCLSDSTTSRRPLRCVHSSKGIPGGTVAFRISGQARLK